MFYIGMMENREDGYIKRLLTVTINMGNFPKKMRIPTNNSKKAQGKKSTQKLNKFHMAF